MISSLHLTHFVACAQKHRATAVEELELELAEAEQQLAELQTGSGEDGLMVLNEEQQKAIDGFVDRKIEIRKKLRDVRHQLDKDIESLGSQLKFINIIVAPILLVLCLFLVRRSFRLNPSFSQKEGI